MRYRYDPEDLNRYVGITTDEGAPNSTAISPGLENPGEMAVWLGEEWGRRPYQAPIPYWSDPNLDSRYWQIYLGRFNARLGMDALAIAASDNEVCKAFVQVLSMSEYVQLNGAEVGNAMNMLISAAQPAANATFPGSGPMTVEKKAMYLQTKTTDYERWVKGLPQPRG